MILSAREEAFTSLEYIREICKCEFGKLDPTYHIRHLLQCFDLLVQNHLDGSQLGGKLAHLIKTLAEPVVQGALGFKFKIDAIVRVKGD